MKKRYIIFGVLISFFSITKVSAMKIYIDGKKREIPNYLDETTNRTYIDIDAFCSLTDICMYNKKEKIVTRRVYTDKVGLGSVNTVFYYTEFLDKSVKNTVKFENWGKFASTSISNTKGNVISMVEKKGKPYVPIRFFAESYWYDVKWKASEPDVVKINSYNINTDFKLTEGKGIEFQDSTKCPPPAHYVTAGGQKDGSIKNNIWSNVKGETSYLIFTWGICNGKFYLGGIK